jgi:peptide/nickel transport system substrate-binding protein
MIEVDLQAQEWSTYVGAATGGQEYPLFLLGWFLDFPDAENYTQPWIENGGQGSVVTSYEDGSITPGVNPELLVALDAQRGLTDPAEREAALDELQNIYAEEVVTVPLWVEPEFIVYRDGIAGDPNLPNPEALNIGASMEFLYSLLRDAG